MTSAYIDLTAIPHSMRIDHGDLMTRQVIQEIPGIALRGLSTGSLDNLRLSDALAVGIVSITPLAIRGIASRGDPTFGVVRIGSSSISSHVSRRIVAHSGHTSDAVVGVKTQLR